MTMQKQPALRGVLLHNESMARHTTWRVGGPARQFYQPRDAEDLAVFLQQLSESEPVFWIGLGSNLLVRDGGIHGTVIKTSGTLSGLTVLPEVDITSGQDALLVDAQDVVTVRAEAGVPCAKVARFSARHDLMGIEFFAGIPGTVGGALAMNAGAFGGQTWSVVQAVETLDRNGLHHVRALGDYQISYRHVVGPADEWFIAARFNLQKGEGATSMAQIKNLLEKRNRTQPTNQASCGSVFRNPPGDHAARLIEASGLKGTCIGGACVSAKHANFIVNNGTATAADIETLIVRVAEIVEREHGIMLIPEVHIIGEFQAQKAVQQAEVRHE